MKYIVTDNNGDILGKFSTMAKLNDYVKRQLAFQYMPMWLEKADCRGEYDRIEKLA